MAGWRAFHPDDVAVLKDYIAAGVIRPQIDRRYPLAEVADALRYVGEGRPKGKGVITF